MGDADVTPSIWNVAKIDADTDAAIADHARVPHELPRVGTMVVTKLSGAGVVMRCDKSDACYWVLGRAILIGISLPFEDFSTATPWHYATPEQRRVAWGGE